MPKNRIDTGQPEGPLSDTPFAKLAAARGNLPDPEPAPPTPVQEVRRTYTVEKTRKGGWPLSVERRGKGKVTVIGNVSGDAAALLKALKKRCGAGGTVREDTVEIQGDQRSAIAQFLDGLAD